MFSSSSLAEKYNMHVQSSDSHIKKQGMCNHRARFTQIKHNNHIVVCFVVVEMR